MESEKQKTKVCKHCKTQIDKGAKICPNCNKKQGGIWKWVIIAIFALAIIGSASDGSEEDDKKANTQDTTVNETENTNKAENNEKTEKKEKVEPKTEYTKYDVSEMMKDLESNAMKAESTYKNQYVEITGRLSVIDSSGKYISLVPSDDEFAFVGVQCYLKKDKQKEQVMEMEVGDIVTLRGKITSVGEVLGYSLNIDSID